MDERANRSATAPQRRATDTIANLALFLNVSAIVAFAICLSESGYGRAGTAVVLGIVAVLCFAASLVCFASDSEATPAPAVLREGT
jgi:hypothetical protein